MNRRGFFQMLAAIAGIAKAKPTESGTLFSVQRDFYDPLDDPLSGELFRGSWYPGLSEYIKALDSVYGTADSVPTGRVCFIDPDPPAETLWIYELEPRKLPGWLWWAISKNPPPSFRTDGVLVDREMQPPWPPEEYRPRPLADSSHTSFLEKPWHSQLPA